MLINLRGVKESGTIFAIPTYFFIVMMFFTVVVGFFKFFAGTLGGRGSAATWNRCTAAGTVTLFLLLRAFCQRHHRPHRRRGDLQRHPGLQGPRAATPASP